VNQWPYFRFQDGSRLTDFLYLDYQITEEKPLFPEMPETRGDNKANLVINLVDNIRKLRMELYYSVYEEEECNY